MTPTWKRVVRITDDSPDPVVGRVLGWEDEDRVIVAWGDEAYTDRPIGRSVPMDEVTPYGEHHEPAAVTCRLCGATLEYEPNAGWVDVVSGDDGGTYDLCPAQPITDAAGDYVAPDDRPGHVPANPPEVTA